MTESITIAGREFAVTHDQPTTEDFETPYLLTPKVKRGAQANYRLLRNQPKPAKRALATKPSSTSNCSILAATGRGSSPNFPRPPRTATRTSPLAWSTATNAKPATLTWASCPPSRAAWASASRLTCTSSRKPSRPAAKPSFKKSRLTLRLCSSLSGKSHGEPMR